MPDERLSEEEETLEELREAEADLSSPHLLEHYLYFPFVVQAQGAGEDLRGRGFEIEIGHEDDEDEWLVVARHRVVVTIRALREIRSSLESLATLRGGDYDGWVVRLDEEQDWDSIEIEEP